MRKLSLVGAALLLSACSTTPDPAKVCTAEWIEPRADAAVDRIEGRVGKALDAFRDVAESWMDGRDPGPIQMFRLSNATKSLEKELENGRGIRDLRMIAQTCNDPELIRSEVFKLLDREGLPTPLLNFLQGTGILDQIIETAEGRAASNGQGSN